MTSEAPLDPPDGCRLEREGAVAVVVIDNARRRNCLSSAVMTDLVTLLDELAADDTCGAVVLTGAENYFCAGGDTKAMAGLSTEEALNRLASAQAVSLAIARHPVPVVAAVEGGAAGGGLALAAACDLVVVAEDARLVVAFERLGLAPDLGSLYFFERRMGLSATRRLVYLASSIDAGAAVQAGLMDELVSPGTARARALDKATQIASRSRFANVVIKQTLAEPQTSLAEALRTESSHAANLYESAAYVEATTEGR